jgi:hypothetical protein
MKSQLSSRRLYVIWISRKLKGFNLSNLVLEELDYELERQDIDSFRTQTIATSLRVANVQAQAQGKRVQQRGSTTSGARVPRI